MCGIAGILNLDRRPVDREVLHKMTRSLAHRGPDSEGLYVHQFVGFCHTRLSIIDLSEAGNQPMASDDGRVWLTYNGEVYNYQEIRKRLLKKGFVFRSNTDTEVVLKAYQCWGTACLQQFNGMFAFAVWDEKEETLFLARDRLGIKPLYYWQCGDTFAFASEIKTLLQYQSVDREINFDSFDNYLTFRYVPGSETIFKGICKCPPAHYMVVSDECVAISRYWDFDFQIQTGRSDDDWEEEFYDLLRDSVRKRLISDVPLGVYLSGGVDSTAVTGLVRSLNDGPLRTFSIGFESTLDERPAARSVSSFFRTTHQEFLIKPEDFSALHKIVWYLDEPFGDIIVLPLFLLSRAARQSVKVVLTGEGGDELLGGYVHQRILARLHAIQKLVPSQALEFLAPVIQLFPIKFLDFWFRYPASMGPKGKERIGILLKNADDQAQRYQSFAAVFSEAEKKSLLTPAIKEQVANSRTQRWEKSLQGNMARKDWHFFNRLIRQEFDTWLPDNILFKQDRLTMGNSIEGRVPFLDHRIVEFCGRLPIRLKTNGTNKRLIRKTVDHRIYKSAEGTKKAFFMPLTGVFEAPYQNLIDTYLYEERVNSGGWWNAGFVRELVAKRRRSPLLYDKQIMMLILWQMWADSFGVEAPA